MQNKSHSLLLLIITCSALRVLAQDGLMPAFKLQSNEIELQRRAQPATYFDKVGRKFAVLGAESGAFEAWAYPLKLLRNFEFSFFIGSSTEPIRGRDIVRYISATPEATTLTYTFQSFTVRAHYIAPINEAGALILLEVNTTEPLGIVCSFLPVMQPMWPAGLGGQYAWWDNEMKAYLISESSRKNHGYIGSPAAVGISYTPAHMLSDVPNQFRIEIKEPKSTVGKFIPIILAGGKGKREDVKAVFKKLVANPEQFYRENVAHYRALRDNTLQVETPDRELNLAFEWAKVAYDNLLVENPDLGTGLIAGLGPSGTGGRPGFGWFFGGDAFINTFSLNSMNAYATAKQTLAFTQKWQRADGKMAHELSQAEGYINWFKDYPYGYIHGDTSPFYLTAMFDYYKMTGDLDFIRSSWASLQRAYDWCLTTDADSDGLMDNSKAGLGALEFGSLIDIQTDVYLGAVWVRAAYCMQQLALAMGEKAMAEKAQQQFERARAAFQQKFWDEANQHYTYAFNAKGEHVQEITPWSAVGMMWELGEPERSVRSLEKLNSSELATDWGTRSISIKSNRFEALNYNYGAVWPFITSWVATAQYKHHLALQGFISLKASARHTFDNGLGFVTEVFSGYENTWPQEAVAHQGFCSAGVVLPFVRGLLGLEGDAINKTITFAPHFPADWEKVTLKNFQIGKEAFAFVYQKTKGEVLVEVQSKNIEPYSLYFAPALALGSEVKSVHVNGKPVKFETKLSTQTVQPMIACTIAGAATIKIIFEPTVELLPPVVESKTGDTNKGLKIISTALEGNKMKLVVEGLAGEIYKLKILNEEKIAAVDGAQQARGTLQIQFAAGKYGEFVRQAMSITLK